MDEIINNIESNEDDVEDITNTQTDPSDTLTFKRSHIYSALLPLAFVTGLAAGYLFWGRDSAAKPVDSSQAAAEISNQPQAAVDNVPAPSPQPEQQEIRRYSVPEDDDPVFGPADAPITIIEFSDYECPYCKKWHLEVWPRLQEAYPDQIRLVYRDFPLAQIHPNATPAAAAANCAGEQDSFWEYNELLYTTNQSLGAGIFDAIAQELKLDMGSFNECLESGRYNEEINADFEYAANLGVSSTPTFFVNGIPVVGAQPFEMFSQLIDQELAGEIP